MKKYTVRMVALLLTAALSLSACAISSTQVPPVVTLPATSASQSQPTDQPSANLSGQGIFENIYQQVNPSVVNIRVTEQATQTQSPFGFFFGQQAPGQSQTQEALGSGFVLDTQGHIVTNNHVVDGANTITVTFEDGTTVPAKVVGTDPDSDLAVIKVDVAADRLHPVQFADSTQVKVGQLAVAIGNPFGLQGTMTVGIVSALGRALSSDSTSGQSGSTYSIPDVIQTDAAINPGNSGGVLVDDAGHVIGVTAAIVSSTNSSAGIGFAIPSIIVQRVAPKLIADGHYDHPRLGISGTSLNSELAAAMKLNADQRGALVVEVQPGGPAEKAGLHGSTQNVTIENQSVQVGGDVIVGIDGHPINSFDDLSTYLARYADVGQTVKLTVLRDGKSQDIDVTLDARSSTTNNQAVSDTQTTPSAGAYLGIYSANLTPEIDQAMGLPSNAQGVLVTQVEQGSPAEKAGLQGGSQSASINGQNILIGGDIIIGVDRQAVDSVNTLQTVLQQYQPHDTVTMTVVRNNQEMQIKVTLGEQTSPTESWRGGALKSRSYQRILIRVTMSTF
jgi:serine protease Do